MRDAEILLAKTKLKYVLKSDVTWKSANDHDTAIRAAIESLDRTARRWGDLELRKHKLWYVRVIREDNGAQPTHAVTPATHAQSQSRGAAGHPRHCRG